MNALPVEVIIILCGIGAVALLWLALRFGRTIARVLLVGGVLLVGIVASLALLNQANASREAARAATVAASGQAVSSVMNAVCVGAMGTVALCAAGAAGVFWLRWQLERRNRETSRRRPRALPQATEPVVYVVRNEGDQDAVDLAGVDLGAWGW